MIEMDRRLRCLSRYALLLCDSAIDSFNSEREKLSHLEFILFVEPNIFRTGCNASSMKRGLTFSLRQAVKNSILKSVLASFSGFFSVSTSTSRRPLLGSMILMLLSALARNMVHEIKYNKTDLFLDIGR